MAPYMTTAIYTVIYIIYIINMKINSTTLIMMLHCII